LINENLPIGGCQPCEAPQSGYGVYNLLWADKKAGKQVWIQMDVVTFSFKGLRSRASFSSGDVVRLTDQNLITL